MSSEVMRSNSLINPSGREGHWIGVDLAMEHHVLFVQGLTMRQGARADSEFVERLSPGTDVYRRLSEHFGISSQLLMVDPRIQSLTLCF